MVVFTPHPSSHPPATPDAFDFDSRPCPRLLRRGSSHRLELGDGPQLCHLRRRSPQHDADEQRYLVQPCATLPCSSFDGADPPLLAENGVAGACGLHSEDSDVVVGLPLEFYNETGTVSTYCGAYVVVLNLKNNLTATARVADASATNGSLSLSVATYAALEGAQSNLGAFLLVLVRTKNRG